MLSDRLYMRDDDHGRRTFPAIAWLIGVIVGGFVVENFFLRWFNEEVGAAFMRTVALSPEGISNGFVWTLFTHALIHAPDGLLHVSIIVLTMLFFGRPVVADLGPKRFFTLFAAAVAAGGVAWLIVNGSRGGLLLGASAGVSALIVVFACLAPQQPITLFLVNFGLRARHIAIGLLIIHVLGVVLVEIPGRDSWFATAHSAQLGGMFAGWCYFRFFHAKRRIRHEDEAPAIEPPAWLRKAKKADSPAPVFKVDIAPVEDMRAEIDRILDKINSDGFQSLTAEEKNRLDHARDHLSRR